MDYTTVASSDWHLGGGDDADDSNVAGLLRIFDYWRKYIKPTDIVLVGDIFERWQFSLVDIVESKRTFFAQMNNLLKETHATIHVVKGNHDGKGTEVFDTLTEQLKDLHVVDHQFHYVQNDWLFLHGHQWDKVNSGGPKQVFAHGMTWVAGVIERIIPGFPVDYLNPESWVSPAHDTNVSVRGDIAAEVLRAAAQCGQKICYGHTHEADLARDQRVVNCGCCVGEEADFVIIFPDGTVNLQSLKEAA